MNWQKSGFVQAGLAFHPVFSGPTVAALLDRFRLCLV
jgi:hypothetical protein